MVQVYTVTVCASTEANVGINVMLEDDDGRAGTVFVDVEPGPELDGINMDVFDEADTKVVEVKVTVSVEVEADTKGSLVVVDADKDEPSTCAVIARGTFGTIEAWVPL